MKELSKKMEKSKGIVLDHIIQFRLKEDTFKILKDYCLKEEMTVSDFVRRIIRDKMKDLKLI